MLGECHVTLGTQRGQEDPVWGRGPPALLECRAGLGAFLSRTRALSIF